MGCTHCSWAKPSSFYSAFFILNANIKNTKETRKIQKKQEKYKRNKKNHLK